jgi:hypothetical protein
LVRIYASWDGEDEELISERFAASYGEEESIAVVVPTRDADEVTVRAELIGNRNNFVGGGPDAIAGGETSESVKNEKIGLWEKIKDKSERKLFNLFTEKAPQNFAKSVLETLAPREESICMMMGEGNLTSIEANHRYDRLRDHLLPVIKGPLTDEFTKAWQEIIKSDPVIYQSKVGEKDPRAEFLPKLRETIEGVYDHSLRELGDELIDYVHVEFADIGKLTKGRFGESADQFLKSGNINDLDLTSLKSELAEVNLLDYLGLRIPLTSPDGILRGNMHVGARGLSLKGIEGASFSSGIDFRFKVDNVQFDLNSNVRITHAFDGDTQEELTFYLEIKHLLNQSSR